MDRIIKPTIWSFKTPEHKKDGFLGNYKDFKTP